MDSAWAALSRLPAAPGSRKPKIMTAAEMVAPLPAPRREDVAAPALPPTSSSSSSSEEGADPTRVPPPPPPFFEHAVQRSDTLMGLSLKYRVSIPELKRLNDLHSDNLATTPILRIPCGPDAAKLAVPAPAPPDSERALVRRFKLTHDVGEEEARYYLSSSSFDYEAATRALQADLDFERRNRAGAERATREAAQAKPMWTAGKAAGTGGGGGVAAAAQPRVREWGARDAAASADGEGEGMLLGGRGSDEDERAVPVAAAGRTAALGDVKVGGLDLRRRK
jgi:LysM repeat protein